MNKPQKPNADFPLFAHNNGQWAKKIKGSLHYFGPWSDPTAAAARFQAKQMPKKSVAADDRPAKPREDFPLFAHATGQWAKKINGKMYYFGAWDNPDAALAKYAADRDDLFAGRGRQTASNGQLTVSDLCKAFLDEKEQRYKSGENNVRTYRDYEDACDRTLKILGKNRPVGGIRPADFAKIRADLATTHGLVRLYKEVQCVRSIFKFAYDQELIDKPVRYGSFRRPSKRAMRSERQQKILENGPKMFAAEDIRKMLKAAGPQLRAMIYLGINCGFGNNDCAMLPKSAIDLKAGFVNFGRPKTGIGRRCPLWPETVNAIKAVLAKRPAAKDARNDDRVFITKYGFTWEPKSERDNPISKETAKLLKKLGIQRKGVNFYALRHTFQTIAEKTLDKDAVRFIMGHVEAANDMSAVYSEQRPEDARLQTCVESVRQWLRQKTSRKAG